MPQLAEELKEEGGVDPEYGETAVVYVAFEEEEERILKQRMAELVDEGFGLSPNPPKDTDGRREDSGRGWVRELQGRWPGVSG